MKPVVLSLVIILVFGLSACNLPDASTPTPQKVFSTQIPTATPDFNSLARGTATPVSFGATPIATTQYVEFVPSYDVDPEGLDALVPTPGTPLKAGEKYELHYPGTTSGIGIWFWIAKQYGPEIPAADLLVKSSKFSQAYLYWVASPAHPTSNFDWSKYKTGVTFDFYLPR